MGKFQLKRQNLLRQHVDLRVLLVDFFGEFLKLGRFACRGTRRWRKCLGRAVKSCKYAENQRAQNSFGQPFHRTFTLALAGFAGKPPGREERGLPLYYFSLNFLHAGARAKAV